MTPTERIAELRALYEAATPGEWGQGEAGATIDRRDIFAADPARPSGLVLVACTRPEDAASIVAMHNAAPAVLAIAEAAHGVAYHNGPMSALYVALAALGKEADDAGV